MNLLIFFVVFEVVPEVYSIFMWSSLGAKYFFAWKNQRPRFHVHPFSFVKKRFMRKNGRVFFFKVVSSKPSFYMAEP